MNYIPLYIKTHNSLLQSMIKINELVEFAKKNNIKSLSITDNNMYGVMEFYELCLKNNIKPVVGLELIYKNNKIILYARNYNGYKNLLKLTTISSSNDITYDNLKKYSNDLIMICLFKSMEIYDEIKDLYDYCFIGYSNIDEYNSINKDNLIYINEILYLDKKDNKYINYLYGIKDGKTIDNVCVDKNDNYLKLIDEIKDIYDLTNNYKIDELCNLVIKRDSNLLPVYKCPNNIDSYDYLKQLCIEGIKRIFGSEVNEIYKDRLKYELSIIRKMGFCNYFLVVWDYVKYAKEHGILVGPGRGSAAGSLVSYCLNITTIDPIKYNLLFERFLNPERVTMPDIDIDFEFNRREEVINYCINKYGEKYVCPIITFGTLGAKQAIRDVGKCMDVDLKVIDYICKMLDSRLSLKENYNNEKLKKYLSYDNNLMNLYKIAVKLEGLKRHTSIHAAGIVMSNIPLDEVIPLDKSHDDFYVTGYSMEYLENLGLLKMDFLALRNLTLINDTIISINKDGINLTFDSIPENDEKALNLFTRADTIGIFQFESPGMINFLKKLKPTTFEDIFSAIALFRPGPMNNIDSYIKRKNNQEKIDYIDESLVKILKSTYGIIVYQEQIMQIASLMANYSLGEADILRRAMSKKKESILLAEKDKFIKQSIDNGYTSEVSTKVFELILKFASYGFNRAHSVAYSMIAYKMAYLKYYYPKYFMKELLTMVIGNESKTKEYIYECRLNNTVILNPDINMSYSKYTVEDNGIRYALNNIKNVGISAANSIVEERKHGKYKDIFDFVKRTYGKGINKKILVSLVNAGCFDSLGMNRNTIITNLDLIINYGEIGELLDETLKPIITIIDEYDSKTIMNKELESFGFYLSKNPISEYKNNHNNIINICDINNYFDKVVSIIISIDKVKETNTKNGDKMCFITGSDEIGTIDCVLFPKIYNIFNDFRIGDILIIRGRVEKRFDQYQISVNELKNIDK